MRFHIHAIDVGNSLQNYIWILIDREQHQAVAIDPTEAQLVLDFCTQEKLTLSQIWITHKHHDHIDGLEILAKQTDAIIYAPQAEQMAIANAHHYLEDQARFDFNSLTVDVISTPGHTLGHICFYLESIDALFSGDTLFALGCGRIFEGSYLQMYTSLQKLAQLPPQTRVYCSHEYTLSNAKFAITQEPDNISLQSRFKDIQDLLQVGKITLPSTIALELATNPFLRCDSVEIFQKVRQLKDHF